MSDPLLRRLPPVNELLAQPVLTASMSRFGRRVVVEAVRAALEEARYALRGGDPIPSDVESIAVRVLQRLDRDRPALRPVINATGVLLHTGLGRAPLAEEAVDAVSRVTAGYCNLELDLQGGARGQRTNGVASLLCRLTGAEAATVVNNNAAATVIALRTVARGREVIVSRGQLVEIGGSFRLPEIFELSGARLREVGTTNRTRIEDYERAIGPETAALLRVHTSNYRILGFAGAPSLPDLARLARSRGLALVDDIGSGALAPDLPPGVQGEPTASEGISVGADLILFSGDKLLGGPQCGLLLGTRQAIGSVCDDPLMRAFRVDKMVLAALEATLRLQLDPARAAMTLPLWQFLTTPAEALASRAAYLAEVCRDELRLDAMVVESESFTGGGSAPHQSIPSFAVRLSPPFGSRKASNESFARDLRTGAPGVVPRIQAGAILLDLRAVKPEEDALILSALREALRV